MEALHGSPPPDGEKVMSRKLKNGTHLLKFSSPSLSYKSTTVEVTVHDKNSGLEPYVAWSVENHPFYSTNAFKLYAELKHSVKRTTIYSLDDENGSERLRICSPEHLAPVFLLWPGRRFEVNLCSEKEPEIPMMDGSALPFFSALRREAGVPEELSFYDAPVHAEWNLARNEGEAPYGRVKIAPSETFEVEYYLSKYDSYARASIYSAENLYNILLARTFISENEYKQARAMGLLEGVDESSGLLLGDSCVEDKSRFRVNEEPAMHKILDLLGDLAFVSPSLPKIRIEIQNGGHIAHHQIMEKLLSYVSITRPSQI